MRWFQCLSAPAKKIGDDLLHLLRLMFALYIHISYIMFTNCRVSNIFSQPRRILLIFIVNRFANIFLFHFFHILQYTLSRNRINRCKLFSDLFMFRITYACLDALLVRIVYIVDWGNPIFQCLLIEIYDNTCGKKHSSNWYHECYIPNSKAPQLRQR